MADIDPRTTYPGKSEHWYAGYQAFLNGDDDTPPDGMAEAESDEWKEGWEEAESDEADADDQEEHSADE
jgi:hypothetical protein